LKNVFLFLVGRCSLEFSKPVFLSVGGGWLGGVGHLSQAPVPFLNVGIMKKDFGSVAFTDNSTEQPIPPLYSRQQHDTSPTYISFQLVPLVCKDGHPMSP